MSEQQIRNFAAAIWNHLPYDNETGNPYCPTVTDAERTLAVAMRKTDVGRLLDAAPDLLEVCKEQSRLIEGLRNLLTCYRIGKRPSEKVLDSVQDPSAVQDRARSAIAKAQGTDAAQAAKE